MTTGADVVRVALDITSSRKLVYRLGAQPPPTNGAPFEFDCSGFVAWVCGRLGVTIGSGPPYTVSQWNACKQAGTATSIEAAIGTPGALLFNHRTPDPARAPIDPPPGVLPRDYHAHVAISRGDGFSIEAMNPGAGVGVSSARPADVRWTAGALIPGVSYGASVPAGPAGADMRAGSIPPFPGEANPTAAADVIRAWQAAMIACRLIADVPDNHDGAYGDGMVKRMNELQASFGWAPDGKGGPHTWVHMYSRATPPCPRCGN